MIAFELADEVLVEVDDILVKTVVGIVVVFGMLVAVSDELIEALN